MSVTFDLPPDVDARLDRFASETGRTKAAVLAEAVQGALEDIIDGFRADEAMARIRSGEDRALTDAEMRRRLGLDH